MKKEKILIIDDEESIRRLVRVSLVANDHVVLEAGSASEGLELYYQTQPQLVILDLGLPDMSGLSVLNAIRSKQLTPVLILTVRDQIDDKVMLLDQGADDYITKPFDVNELLARVRVLLRHRRGLGVSEQSLFLSGPLHVDLQKSEVHVAGVLIRLTATEYELLLALIRHAGETVSHRQLLKEVWGPGFVVQVQYLRVFFRMLRKKIEPDPDHPVLLVSEIGRGYRLNVLPHT